MSQEFKTAPVMDFSNPLVNKNVYDQVVISLNDNSGPNETRAQWKDGLCDCFNNIYPSMVCSFLTPVIYTGQQIERLTRKSCSCCCFSATVLTSHAVSLALVPYSMLWSSVFGVFSGVTFLTAVSNVRNEIRRRNNVAGGDCEDIMLSVFCTPCSLAQGGRELYRYERICDGMDTCRAG